MNENTVRPRAEVLLHPVRLRVVSEFTGRERSVGELAGALPDVPQASLYRHVAALVDSGVLEQVSERAARGPSERVYRVRAGGDRIRPEEIDTAPAVEQRRMFSIFAASLIDSFAAYVGSAGAVPSADGLAFNRAVVHLSPQERLDFATRFETLVEEILAVPPGDHRRRYHIASCFIPTPQVVA